MSCSGQAAEGEESGAAIKRPYPERKKAASRDAAFFMRGSCRRTETCGY